MNKGDNNTGIELKDSTCKDTGLKKTYMKCDRTGCGDEYVEEEIIEKRLTIPTPVVRLLKSERAIISKNLRAWMWVLKSRFVFVMTVNRPR